MPVLHESFHNYMINQMLRDCILYFPYFLFLSHTYFRKKLKDNQKKVFRSNMPVDHKFLLMLLYEFQEHENSVLASVPVSCEE
jgi:hypothetical protein